MIALVDLLEAAAVAVMLSQPCTCGCGRMLTSARKLRLLAPAITGEA